MLLACNSSSWPCRLLEGTFHVCRGNAVRWTLGSVHRHVTIFWLNECLSRSRVIVAVPDLQTFAARTDTSGPRTNSSTALLSLTPSIRTTPGPARRAHTPTSSDSTQQRFHPLSCRRCKLHYNRLCRSLHCRRCVVSLDGQPQSRWRGGELPAHVPRDGHKEAVAGQQPRGDAVEKRFHRPPCRGVGDRRARGRGAAAALAAPTAAAYGAGRRPRVVVTAAAAATSVPYSKVAVVTVAVDNRRCRGRRRRRRCRRRRAAHK